MKAKIIYMLVLVVAVAVSGCVSWARIDSDSRMVSNAAFTVELPVGWVRLQSANDSYEASHKGERQTIKVDRVVITRDGLNLEQIDLIRFNAQNAFPHINKPYKNGMLASEAAELYVADLKAAGLDNLSVVKNAPKEVAGKSGFELHVKFKNDRGLQSERLIYAFGDNSGFYLMSYQAPTLHYFEMYKEVFVRIAQSFRVTTGKA